MMENKMTPLEQLRQEKVIAKREVNESEDRLAVHWNYLHDNLGALLLNGAVNAAFKGLGFKSSHKEETVAKSKVQSPSLFKTVLGGLTAASPLIWELAQPMLMGYAMKKIKSIFSGKKKR